MRTISYLCQHVCHLLLNELIRGKRTPKLLSARESMEIKDITHTPKLLSARESMEIKDITHTPIIIHNHRIPHV